MLVAKPEASAWGDTTRGEFWLSMGGLTGDLRIVKRRYQQRHCVRE